MISFSIDIGNSRSKLGLFKGRSLLKVVAFSREAPLDPDFFSNLKAEKAVASSVLAEKETAKRLDFFQGEILLLDQNCHLPITNRYESPATLGRDRLAAVVGANSAFPEQNVLVIDIGTCITYDFLSGGKEYFGGAISPGVQMRLAAMNQNTDKLPMLQWSQGSAYQLIGVDTESSMLSGAVNGAIAEMDGIINSYKKLYKKLKIVLTGGDSAFFEKKLKNTIFADSNLVLKGLNEILLYNSENH